MQTENSSCKWSWNNPERSYCASIVEHRFKAYGLASSLGSVLIIGNDKEYFDDMQGGIYKVTTINGGEKIQSETGDSQLLLTNARALRESTGLSRNAKQRLLAIIELVEDRHITIE